jgi:hypothetical protein
MLATLLANYESKYYLNPLERTRKREIVTSRHCLTFILMNRFGLGSSEVGRLIKVDHATALHSAKVVKNMLLTKESSYIDEIVRWSEVFDEVLPDGGLSTLILQQRIELLLTSMTDDRDMMIQAMESVLKKIKLETTDLRLIDVI